MASKIPSSEICTFNIAEITLVKTDDGRFHVHEADMTILLVWSECDLPTNVLSDDTYVVFLL